MTLDELRLQIQQICSDTMHEVYKAKRAGSERLYALFQDYRDDVFKVSQRVPEHWELEKDLKDQDAETYRYLRDNALAFFTCSCGSRQDSCAEDGVGNFSTFIFTQEGNVFRRVEKRQ